MKLRFLKFQNWLLALIASALGISLSSCMEYGSPIVEYEFKGKVTAEDGTPIPGIQVSFEDNAFSEEPEEYPIATTGTDGQYHTTIQSQYYKGYFFLIFQDIDGPDNGSYYNNRIKIYNNDLTFYDGDNEWYLGRTEITVNITLPSKPTTALPHPASPL